VNKAVKEFLKKKFQQWYSGEVESLYHKNGKFTPVDLHMSKMKPVGAQWVVLRSTPLLARQPFTGKKWISYCRNY